jgi:formylglycine-generating enzyme required for sulfatase activity
LYRQHQGTKGTREVQPLRLLLTLALMIVLGGFLGVVGAASAQDRRIALVIGNSAYRNAEELPNPRNDARAIGEALERLGFEVDTQLDLTHTGLQDALREFGYQAESADVAVVFYAGHGIQVDNGNYLLPVDAMLRRERDLIYEALPLTLVMGEVAQARELGLVIVDACRDNPLAERLRQSLGPIRSRMVGTGLARMDNVPSDTMIAFSTRPGEVAVDGSGGHSPYTEALLRHIEEPGLELDLLFRKVRDTVLELTAQRQEPRTYDALGAQPFYFKEPRPNQRPEIAEVEAVNVLDSAGASALGIPPPSDPDGDPVTVQVTGLPRDGAVAVSERAVVIGDVLSPQQLAEATYDPSGQFTGEAGSFVFLVRDDRGGLSIGRIAITVTPSNKPPVVTAQQVLQVPVIPLNIEEPVDPDGDPLTITIVRLPETGQIRSGERALEVGDELSAEELAGLVLEPESEGASGIFAFEVADPDGASATSALQINVPAFGPLAAPQVATAEPEAAPEEPVAALEEPATAESEVLPEEPVEQAATEPPAAARPSVVERSEPAATFAEYVALRDSNIREGPSTETARVGTVSEGATLRVLGKVEDREWFEVETGDGVKGYIYAGLIEPSSTPVAEEPVAVAEAPAEPEPEAPVEEPPPPAGPAQQMAQLTAGRNLGGSLRDCESCPELVPVQGGSFVMGSDFGHRSERPAHRVAIEPFAIGRYEVTVGEYQACVDAGACDAQPSMEEAGRGTPIFDLSWTDAQDYVAWLREVTGEPYRLPTEAEWEFAARAGSESKFWWGDEVGVGNANCQNCGGAYDKNFPASVGSFKANPLGLHGMNGGVMEWVADCWSDDYQGAPTDGTAWNQQGCDQRVLRGGSWRNDQTYATSTSRLGYDFGVRYLTNGFRVARDIN